MGTETFYCAVKGGFTRFFIPPNVNYDRTVHIQKDGPCVGCKVHSLEMGEVLVKNLAAEEGVDIVSTHKLDITIVRHEDYPVPEVVKVGEPIVMTCSDSFA